MPRHFLRDDDLTPAEQREVLDLALRIKAEPLAWRPLEGPRAVALLLDKPTLRTQVSFAVGIAELGGYCLAVDGTLARIGQRESVADTARVLARQVSAVVWRTYDQSRIDEMAAHVGVPVVNALTDQFHPCQVLADLQTVAEHCGGLAADGPALGGRSLAYLGDTGNNMAHSYLLGGATAGLDVRLAGPAGFRPRADVLERAQEIAGRTGARILVTQDPAEAVDGADAVATDTWVSMGQEAEAAEREAPFVPYRLDAARLAQAGPGAVVLHCLPAYRGKEITAEVLDGPAAVVWDEAENRRHAQKALLVWLLRQA